jgi:hypothetical protein
MKNKSIALCLMALVLTVVSLYAQEDKLSFEMEFNGSLVSADSEGVVDSLVDSAFNDGGTKIGISYEDERWGASASLKFGDENLRFISGEIGEMFAGFPLALDELYGWVKPFGSFKFTGGIFENTDGIADYTGDIDDYGIGVFFLGEDDEVFTEPTEITNAALVNGFLTDVVFGPVTLQLLLAPNYSKESASALSSGLLTQIAGGQSVEIDAKERFFRLGGRIIVDAGIGTVAAVYKTSQWPVAIENGVANLLEPGFPGYPGSKNTYNTFGAYFDVTAAENLGVSLGYTGFLPVNDGPDVENPLFSGIDLRAAWTGIPGLSLSTHNNITFAKGVEKDWTGMLGKDASFLTLYNAVGGTKELTDVFSVNAEISNVLATTDLGAAGKVEYDSFGVSAKLIAAISDRAEFNVGAKLDITKTTLSGAFGDADDTLTVFSIPVGIVLSF